MPSIEPETWGELRQLVPGWPYDRPAYETLSAAVQGEASRWNVPGIAAGVLKDGAIVHHCNLEEERRSNRSFVELEVSGDDRQLRTALPHIGAEGVSEGGGRWRIVLPAGVEVEAIWALAARQDLLVRKLTHRRDTLEEIFLKAMGHLSVSSQPPAPSSQQEAGQ